MDEYAAIVYFSNLFHLRWVLSTSKIHAFRHVEAAHGFIKAAKCQR